MYSYFKMVAEEYAPSLRHVTFRLKNRRKAIPRIKSNGGKTVTQDRFLNPPFKSFLRSKQN